jgi:hypothetical protein
MRRDFTKKNVAMKRTSEFARWLRILLIGVMVLLLTGIIFFAYQYPKGGPGSSVIASYSSRITHFIAAHKNHLHRNLVKVKQLTMNKNESEPQIHFEFYTALPNMHISASEASATLNKDNKQGQ